ncbi:MAG: glycosyltransferase [Woeseia sp.]
MSDDTRVATAPEEVRHTSGSRATVSVIIKALNEEQGIAASIRSALRALEPFKGEVILADSGSSDRTIAIAEGFPVTIVQLADTAERCCGIGPQLGYQFARGQYVYILDGDMELNAAFLLAGVHALERDARLGGVAGIVTQQADASYQFRGLARRRIESCSGDVQWLDMGGLYRQTALEQVGYFSNRNLHAFEEMELGLRLSSAGWQLRRLAIASVQHRGYDLNSFALLKRRWQSGYLLGAGELLKASWGQPYLMTAVRSQKFLLIALLIWLGFFASLLALPMSAWPLAGIASVVVALIALRACRIRSLKDALIGQAVWQVHALALVRGFLRPMKDPKEPVAARLLKVAAPDKLSVCNGPARGQAAQ